MAHQNQTLNLTMVMEFGVPIIHLPGNIPPSNVTKQPAQPAKKPILDQSWLPTAITSAENVLYVAQPKPKDLKKKLLNVKQIVVMEFLLVPEIAWKAKTNVWLVLQNVENTKTAVIWKPTSWK